MRSNGEKIFACATKQRGLLGVIGMQPYQQFSPAHSHLPLLLGLRHAESIIESPYSPCGQVRWSMDSYVPHRGLLCISALSNGVRRGFLDTISLWQLWAPFKRNDSQKCSRLQASIFCRRPSSCSRRCQPPRGPLCFLNQLLHQHPSLLRSRRNQCHPVP